MEKLDSRLKTAAEYVNENTVAADIGTDHGYLACYLIQNNICKHVFATDINEKPLESARHNIADLGLEEYVDTCLTDGLEGLDGKIIDEIIICGMGGETIIGILQKHDWVKSERVHLVLQPMTRGDTLRRWLLENGWYIDDEKAVEAEGHLYSVMSVYYCGQKTDADDMYYLTGELMKNPDSIALKYIRWQSEIQRKISEGLMKGNDMKSALEHLGTADMLDMEADWIEGNL